MLVMKFGGTSVGTAEAIRQVRAIVKTNLKRRPLVVCSAHSGVTDLLLAQSAQALDGARPDGSLAERHHTILAELGLPADLLATELHELEQLLSVVAMLGELTPRTRDRILSFGERLSCKVVAACLRQDGLDAEDFPAWELGLLTDAEFGAARPLEGTDKRIAACVSSLRTGLVPVVTGFISKTEGGQITTLGRGGSDYTAAIFGAAIAAEEVQIWTDVSGVMTADPKLIDAPRPLPLLSFAEAAELATFGAKVIHPATMLPAMERGIAIRVLNTFRPDDPGTCIVNEARATERVVKSIASKRAICMIDIISSRMLGQAGFLARIAQVFAACAISLDVIASSEVSVSVSVESSDPDSLQRAMALLESFAKVRLVEGLGQICIVGEGLRSTPGVAGRAFTALGEAGINVVMISQGASQINLSLLVDGSRTGDAVRALHGAFFEQG